MTEFRASAGERWTLAICAALMALLALFVAAVAIGAFATSPLAGALVALAAAVLIGMTALIVQEARAAFRLNIALDGEVLRLRLPRRRGHVVLPATDADIPLAGIALIETRAEAFRQIGAAAIQQTYRLTLKDGGTIILGADRQMKPPVYGRAAAAIAERIGFKVADRGMVDGKPGVLAVAGTSVPEWSAPPLAPTEADRRRATAARAFKIMAWIATLATLVRLIARR